MLTKNTDSKRLARLETTDIATIVDITAEVQGM